MIIEASPRLADAALNEVRGRHLDELSYDMLITGNRVWWRDGRITDPGDSVTVVRPDGSPLVIYRADVLPREPLQRSV
jgi:hypothetical protein